MRRVLLLVLTLGASGCAAELGTSSKVFASQRWADDTEPAWAEMQRALEGRWQATTPENRTIATSYRVVSKSSALIETFTSASGRETLSVYHRDGRALMVTHYCAQGNQARLKATEATRERIVFTFLDATNVGADQSVMQRLVFVLRPDGFDQETVYKTPTGELESATLHFVRLPTPAPP